MLIVTQVMDLDHPILGFFHRWVVEFATQCESVEVICLQEGRHELPNNVTVHTLGKEDSVSCLQYVWRFYKYAWQLRQQYDGVFVHMNQVYVLLGWPLWTLLRTRVSLWYMHGSTPISLRVASRLVNKIFTGSPESFRLRRSNLLVTGHGIDTGLFKPQEVVEKKYDLITVGRITSSKNITELVEILSKVENKTVTLAIVGAPVTEAEQSHEQELKQLIATQGLTKRVHWLGRVSQTELPGILCSARVFVTAARNGSLDKAMLEAMACGLPVVSMAPGSASLPLGENQLESKEAFVHAIARTLVEHADSMNLVAYVQQNHSLDRLVAKIIATYS